MTLALAVVKSFVQGWGKAPGLVKYHWTSASTAIWTGAESFGRF